MKTLWMRVMSYDEYAAKSSETAARNGALGRKMRGYGFSASETDMSEL
jgi:hypothetical protein